MEKMSRSQKPPQKGKAKQVIHKMRVKTVHAYLSTDLFYFIIFDENDRLVVTCVGLFLLFSVLKLHLLVCATHAGAKTSAVII